MNLDDREERQVAAAEFLLDRLSPRERDTFEDRMADDPSLRDLVEQWRIRLENRNVPLLHPSVEGNDGRVRRRRWLGRRKQSAEPAVRHLRRRLDAWRMIAVAGIVTTTALAYFLFARPPILDAPGGAADGTRAGLPLETTTGISTPAAPEVEEGGAR